LTLVFQVLAKHHLFIKESKCLFAQQSLEYLGHVITAQVIITDPSKITVVNQWPVPTNVKELRGFLGLVGYYMHFIKNYGIISRPLTELLKKGVLFMWSSIAQQTFEAVKQALTTTPILALLTSASLLFWKSTHQIWTLELCCYWRAIPLLISARV
jgi:hypothetical protein